MKVKCCEPIRDKEGIIKRPCDQPVIAIYAEIIGGRKKKYPVCAIHLKWYKERGLLDTAKFKIGDGVE